MVFAGLELRKEFHLAMGGSLTHRKKLDGLTLFLPTASIFAKRKTLPCFMGDGGGRFLIQNSFVRFSF